MKIVLLLAFLAGSAKGQILLPILVGKPVSGGATFTLVQVDSVTYTGSSAFVCGGSGPGTWGCTLTATLGAGHVAILVYSNVSAGAGATATSIVGGGTWTTPSSCNVTDNNHDLTCAVNVNTSSASSIAMFLSAAPQGFSTISLWEYSCSPSCSGAAFANAGNAGSDGAATSHNGVTPSSLGTNNVIVQTIALTLGADALSVTTYGNIQDNANVPTGAGTYGSADLENSVSTSPPVWTTQFGDSIRSYVAIKI